MLKTLLASAVLAVGVATTAIAAPTFAATPGNAPFTGSAPDNAFDADMSVVHEMLFNHDKIKRSVTNLPNGIRTVTESDDPHVAKEIREHVASMAQRLKDGRVFNVASRTLPAIFANDAKIDTKIEQTRKGVIVTQVSTDPATVAALQSHAREVSDLVQGGMVALMRQVMANGGPMHDGSGPHDQMGPRMMRGMTGMTNHVGANGPPMMAQPMMPQMMQRMMQSGGPMDEMRGGPPTLHGQGPLQGPPSQTTP